MDVLGLGFLANEDDFGALVTHGFRPICIEHRLAAGRAR